MTQSRLSLGCMRRNYGVAILSIIKAPRDAGMAYLSMLLAPFLFRVCLMIQLSFELQLNYTSEYNRFMWSS